VSSDCSIGKSHSSNNTSMTEDHEFGQVQPEVLRSSAVYDCPFWVLHCGCQFEDTSEWKDHVSGHFEGKEPPIPVECLLCDDFRAFATYNLTAWEGAIAHMLSCHGNRQNITRNTLPEGILNHLALHSLITGADMRRIRSSAAQQGQNIQWAVKRTDPMEAATSEHSVYVRNFLSRYLVSQF